MCVIAIVDEGDIRPTEAHVRAMFDQNDAGGGIAWRGIGQVHWKKGLGVEEMVELNQTLPIPYVMHFRIPSCGGGSRLLTHPFLISKEVPLAMEGTTEGAVLFHNGHWGRYESIFNDALFKGAGVVQCPEGSWSDTRVMAWLAAHFGIGYLEWIENTQKLVVFSPTAIKVFGDGWDYFHKEYLVSNKHWDWRLRPQKQNIEVFNPLLSESEARQQMRQRGFLGLPPAQGENRTDNSGAPVGATKPKTDLMKHAQEALDKNLGGRAASHTLAQVAGGTPLDELSFRSDRNPLGLKIDSEAAIQEAEEVVGPQAGQGVEGAAQAGSGGEAHECASEEGGSDSRFGISLHHSLGDIANQLLENAKWVRSIGNPKKYRSSEGRVIHPPIDEERERRRALLMKGIVHVGEL
jgi:hypothetical protein